MGYAADENGFIPVDQNGFIPVDQDGIVITMADYLSTVTPDYSERILNINPHDIIQTTGGFNQITHKPDGGQDYIVTLNDVVDYYVTLKWIKISALDKSTILDFYYNPLKAKGLARSFIWYHPEDELNYVVKFKSKVNESVFATSHYSISGITLRVLGVPA